MQTNKDVDPGAVREYFRKLFDEIYAKKPTKPRDLKLRAGRHRKPATATPDNVAKT
jgi:hypothetical protein